MSSFDELERMKKRNDEKREQIEKLYLSGRKSQKFEKMVRQSLDELGRFLVKTGLIPKYSIASPYGDKPNPSVWTLRNSSNEHILLQISLHVSEDDLSYYFSINREHIEVNEKALKEVILREGKRWVDNDNYKNKR